MKRIDLSTGTIEYRDVGSGPIVLFVHGFLADSELWRGVVDELAPDFRCIAPNWPLGSHTIAQNKDADLSVTGVAALIAEFIDALDLADVTLVGNDSGGAISQLVTADHGARVGRLVLTNCDALEVFPPKAFRYIKWMPKVPGLAWLVARSMKAFPSLARWKYAYGGLATEPIARKQLVRWVTPMATDRGIRRDALKLVGSADNQITIDVADRLARRDIPVRMVWGARDPFFTLRLAERLAARLPDAEVRRVDGGKTFVMLDEPARVAAEIRELVWERTGIRSAS